jgi:two-component system sensor histidine kinase BaeS
MKKLVRRGLLYQMLLGQAVIVLVTGLILIGTALLLAPGIFNDHFDEAGITSESDRLHVSEAFSDSITISLGFAALASIVISGSIGWILIRRFVKPIQEMATFAGKLAAGKVELPATFTVSNTELDELAEALSGLSKDLASSREEQARMLSDVAHELRTPIATIQAMVDGIEDGVVEGNSDSWRTIREHLERLNRLSHDVRDVSENSDQVLSSIRRSCRSYEICAGAYAGWLQRYGSKGVSLNLLAQETLPVVSVDEQRIGQVLSNLLENALRHTPSGGNVTISAQDFGTYIEIKVVDDGEGISPQNIAHVFERLFRGDAARKSGDSGSGLGLTIAQSIAEGHGGTLTAHSDGLGKGSTFVLTLPV